MSNNAYPRGRRKQIKGAASVAVASDRPTPVPESLILRVLRDAAVQLAGNSNIVTGRDILVAGRDIHITITMVVQAPQGDSRPSKRGSR